jgi:hypothetical protein
VIGTMVWDTVHRFHHHEPQEEWGGISFALAALDVALPDDWVIVPLIKVGRDLAPEANRFLATLDRRAENARFIEVPEPNNRVTLHYRNGGRRTERLRGGVPGWQWHELGPLVHDLDAIYCNMISGFELTLETAQLLRRGYVGPIYADLHSLTLAVGDDGLRIPQPLTHTDDWFSCFDVVQVNEDELSMIGADPMAVAARALRNGVNLLIVTLADQGAVYFTAGQMAFGHNRSGNAAPTLRTAKIPAVSLAEVRDPTGCGDVFGATVVSHLIRGDSVEDAVRAANVFASRNAQYHGATNLQYHLRGEIVPR